MSAPTIHDIPLEILQEIFLEACDHRYLRLIVEATETPKRYPPFQHTLSAVSRRWRLIAASFTTLWSNITIVDHYNSGHDILRSPSPFRHRYLMSLATVIRCAGNASLTCNIHLTKKMNATTIALLKMLIATSNRWISLRIEGTKISSPDVFLPLYKNLPLLQSLDFDIHNGNVNKLYHIFSIAPNLVKVKFELHATQFILPWAQLRRVEFLPSKNFQPFPYLQNLQQSSKLEHLHYFALSKTVRAPGDCPIITLPSVKVANIFRSNLLSLLALPSLETATVAVRDLAAFKRMISNSGCLIRDLTVNTHGPFPLSIMTKLERHNVPALTRLTMKWHAEDSINAAHPHNLKTIMAQFGLLQGHFLGLEEIIIKIPLGKGWEDDDGLAIILDALWGLARKKSCLRHITLEFRVWGKKHVQLMGLDQLDRLESYQKLRKAHAAKAPCVDLAIFYEGLGQKIHLMYPHSDVVTTT